jgi:hypothetical protein
MISPKKYFFISLLLFALFSVSNAQVMTSSENYALIFPRSGDGFAANILRFEKDTLIVYTTDYKYIAKKDIGKIILHPRKESGKGFKIGAIFGVYAVNYWLGTANIQPGAFLWSDIYGGKYSTSFSNSSSLAAVGIALLGVAVGGGIGYLLDLNHDASTETIYIFGGSPEMQEEEWTKLREIFVHKVTHGKFHFNISGGLITAPVSHAYFDQLNASGYNTANNFNSNFNNFNSNGSTTNLTAYQGQQVPTDVNWLRTFSMSYSLTDNLEVGLCYALLGQPSFVYSKETQFLDTNVSSFGTALVGQKLDGKGYYATAGYYTYFGKDDDFELTVTGGLGLANISFDLNGQFDFNSNFLNEVQQDNVSIQKLYFSGMISAGISYYIYDNFSFGLNAHYFYVGNSSARGMPFVSLNPQDLNFSTGDIGFTLGLHF